MNSCYMTKEEINKLNPEHILVSIFIDGSGILTDTLDSIKGSYSPAYTNIEILDDYLSDATSDDQSIAVLKDNKFVAVDITVGDEGE